MDLPLIGRAVELVTFSPFGLWLTFPDPMRPETSPGSDYVLRIEGPFRFISATAVLEVDPNDGPNPVYLGLLQRVVEDAVATEDGSLAISFVDGDRLEVRSGRYESWELTGKGQSVLSVAGGGLARSGPGDIAAR
jgi:Family of unknown function (DUF6188)